MARIIFGSLFIVLALGAPGQVNAQIRHPALHLALYELREARTELKNAAHDFGGHREKCLLAVDAAIKQIDLALKATNDNIKGFKAPGADVYKKYPNYPHLHHLMHALREAQVELKNAKHDYGGHREQALKDVNYALEQLVEGAKYAMKK